MGAVVGFATMGLNEAFCPESQNANGDVGKLEQSPGEFEVIEKRKERSF